MAIVILFGAGASAGSGECYPKAPPLGSELFSELRQRGGIAAEVDRHLEELFAQNFERGMAEFQKTRRTDTPALLRQMSEYFVRFEPGRANLYLEVFETLQASRRSFAIATLNYAF
jgi:hypothetical protein